MVDNSNFVIDNCMCVLVFMALHFVHSFPFV